jgi:hypothetical protein
MAPSLAFGNGADDWRYVPSLLRAIAGNAK